jgi:hypothetical protein
VCPYSPQRPTKKPLESDQGRHERVCTTALTASRPGQHRAHTRMAEGKLGLRARMRPRVAGTTARCAAVARYWQERRVCDAAAASRAPVRQYHEPVSQDCRNTCRQSRPRDKPTYWAARRADPAREARPPGQPTFALLISTLQDSIKTSSGCHPCLAQATRSFG